MRCIGQRPFRCMRCRANPTRVLCQVKSDDATHHLLVRKFFNVHTRALPDVNGLVADARRRVLEDLKHSRTLRRMCFTAVHSCQDKC